MQLPEKTGIDQSRGDDALPKIGNRFGNNTNEFSSAGCSKACQCSAGFAAVDVGAVALVILV
jgi:hypothetical protein